MIHRQATEQVVERASLYALDALDPAERLAFEAHLAAGCPVCSREVASFALVAEGLGAASPTPASGSLRARVLDAAARIGPSAIVRAGDGDWRSTALPGVEVRRLGEDPVRRRATTLVRMAPGVTYPSHRHADTEELFVLDGDLEVHGRALGPGDSCAARASSHHGVGRTSRGCTFVVRASSEDAFLTSERPVDDAGITFVFAAERRWHAVGHGAEVSPIFGDPDGSDGSTLVRVPPGRPPGALVGAREVYVIEGDLWLGTGVALRAGDYWAGEAGIAGSERGGTALVLSGAPGADRQE